MNENYLFDRRTLIGAAAGLPLLALGNAATSAAATPPVRGSKSFPKGFYWGASTAGHQIEGNNVNADYWALENVKPTIFQTRSGDACDSYHRYEEDIAMLARLGLRSYRFSLEWARVEPNRGSFSQAEIDYYRRVVDCCRKYDVAPCVTFTHYTVPAWFAAAGGWTNAEAPALFANFCSRMAKAIAGEISLACTMNEPQLPRALQSLPGSDIFLKGRNARADAMHAAAARAIGSDRFVTLMDYGNYDRMVPLLIAGHEQAVLAIKAERSNLPTGVTLSVIDFQPANEGADVQSHQKRNCGEWYDTIRRTCDFVGVQAYHQFRIKGPGAAIAPPPPLPLPEPKVISSTLARPEALRNCVNHIHEKTGKPIIVTENGIETNNDARRAWYIQAALAGLHESIASGVPVLGYFHWTLIDNWEWDRGFEVKYGLASVDTTSFKRTPKPSAQVLGAIARHNSLS